MERRRVLLTGATLVAAASIAALPSESGAAPTTAPPKRRSDGDTLKVKDGTTIYYKDWGTGQPVVLSHGWPLSADAWDSQMLFLAQQGYRVIAYDRRGHGRSSQPWDGYDNDTMADDLSALIEKLDLKRVILVSHSMGAGECARYVGRHGTSRLAKMVFISGVAPSVRKTEANPNGVPMSVFDGLRQGIVQNRPQFYRDLSSVFYGYNKPGAKASPGLLDEFFRVAMQSSIKGSYDCTKAFSEDDFTNDLKKIDVPTLFVHGDADQIVPAAITSEIGPHLVRQGSVKIIPGAPHGLCSTHADQINQVLIEFIRA
jgi:non-heme chloroperoxidase